MKKILTALGVLLTVSPAVADVYFAGPMTDWANNNIKMTEATKGDGNHVYLRITAKQNDEFKLIDGSEWLGGASVSLNTPCTPYGNNSGNMKLPATGYLQLDYYHEYSDNHRLTVTQVSYPSSIYVIGNVDGSGFSPLKGVELKGSNGKYEGIVNFTPSGSYSYFSFAEKIGTNNDSGDWSWTNLQQRFGAPSSDKEVNLQGDNDLWYDGNKSFKVTPGTYKVVVDLPNMKLNVTPTGPNYPDNLYLIGYYDDTAFVPNKGYKLEGQDGVYSGTVNLTSETTDPEHVYSYFRFTDKLANNADWDNGGIGTQYGAPSGNYLIHNGTWGLGINSNAYKIYPGKYNITVDLTQNQISIEPTEIYMYGHVNSKYWLPNNYVTLSLTETPGVYKTNNADISGTWGPNDLKPGLNRKLNESTDNVNYIAFYDHLVYDQDKFGEEKYGSESDNDNVLISTDNPTGKLVYRKSGYSNFQVPDGVYDVQVDLNNLTVTFLLQKKEDLQPDEVKEVTYTWYMGEDDPEMIDHEVGHSLTFGDEKSDIIQVGLGENPGHRVARQAVYEVKYREPNYVTANAKQIKAYADDEEVLDRDSDGFYTAREGKEIMTIGSENYADNHLIQLMSAGEYQITASLHDDAQNVDEFSVQPNTLSVTVAQASVDITGANEATTLTKKFENTTKGITYDQAIIIKNSDTQTIASSITTSDFTVEIVPENNGEGWAKIDNYDPEETDVDAAYKAQLPASLYEQYLSAKGEGIVIDGLYTEVADVKVTAVENTPGTFNVTAVFPCSGKYQIIVTPVATGNATFETTTITYEITPNLNLTYGNNIGGLNLNGVGLTDNQFEYPCETDDKTTPWTPKGSYAYTPGLYFADEMTIDFGNTAKGVKRYAGEEDAEEDNTYWGAPFDTSIIPSGTSTLNATVTKNGTSGVTSFVFNLNTQIPTGVEGIESVEEGEAVYYNLQGVKVENPEHGIYVKVVNGKASKVVL